MSIPNLPNNQIVIDQSDRGAYGKEEIETYETGAHYWRSLQKGNPSYFHAIPAADGKFSTHEHQANGHYHQIINSTKSTQQDSRSDGTTNNKQTQTGGGSRNVTGQGEHREHGADDTKAVSGSTIAISKSTHTHMSTEHGHHSVKGDYGFYVQQGGYSIGAEQQVVVTSEMTMHIEAQSELSLKGIQNVGITTKGKMTFDSTSDMLANTASSFAANAAQNATVNAGQNISLTAGSQLTLTVGGSTITMDDNSITLKAGSVIVNNQQETPTSSLFT